MTALVEMPAQVDVNEEAGDVYRQMWEGVEDELDFRDMDGLDDVDWYVHTATIGGVARTNVLTRHMEAGGAA